MRNFLFVFLISACGGGGSGGGDVSPEGLPAELAEVTCAKLAECCTTMEFMDATLGADNEAECRALFTSLSGLLTTALDDSIAKGRVIYHADRMAACLDGIADLTCSQYRNGGDELAPDGCDNPFEPLVATGGECVQDFDCIGGFCDGGSVDFDNNITYGACVDRIAIGAACTDSEACEPAGFCDFSTGSPVCAAKLADGSGCTSGSQCASDTCNGAETGNGTCGPDMTCDGN